MIKRKWCPCGRGYMPAIPKRMAGFLFGHFFTNKTIFILISYVIITGYLMLSLNNIYAAESSGNFYNMDLFTISNGSGGAASGDNIMEYSVIGDMVSVAESSSTGFILQSGQVYLMMPILEQRTKLISDLRALTEVMGPTIPAATWQKDNDPYFYWHIDVEPASIIKGFTFGLDTTPDETIDTQNPYYQFETDTLVSGKHTFNVVPVVASGPYQVDMLSLEIWVDTDSPVISNTLPQPNSLTANGKIPLSGLLSDRDSGVNLGLTTLLLNGSSVTYKYTQESQSFEYTPSGHSQGRNTVLLTAYDMLGNYVTKGWDFLVDTIPPSGSVSINNGEAVTTSGHVFLRFNAEDAISGVRNAYISQDGVFDTELNNPYSYQSVMAWVVKDPEVDGIKTVYVKFDDLAGNISATYEDTIELSLLTPDTKIISGPASITDETAAQFKYEATKLNCKFSYKLDENIWSEWSDTQSVTFTGQIVGNHYFYVKSALDLNGDTEISPDEEDPTPAQWVWMIESEKEYQKAKRKTLFWRR